MDKCTVRVRVRDDIKATTIKEKKEKKKKTHVYCRCLQTKI